MTHNQEKVALVTGSNKGIGFETVRQLISSGVKTYLTGRNERRVSQAVASLDAQGLKAHKLVLDITSDASVSNAANLFAQENECLDILGAYSKDVQRFKADKKADILGYVKKLNRRGDSVLVQPYLNSIDLVGETDLIFFNGQYSHAIRKGALLAADGTVNVPTSDFRQEHEPDETEITVASKALKVTADRFGLRHPLLYARVDLIRDIKGDPVVLEMELAEPSLSLPNCRGSATRFAYALNEMCREDELASVS